MEQGRSGYYVLGMICGFLLAYLLMILLRMLIRRLVGNTDGRAGMACKPDSFDERQQLARGQAYKRAFFVLTFYVAVVSMLSEGFHISIFMSFGGLWLGVCIAIIVFAVNCILHDAYMSLYENAKGLIIMLSCVGILNVLIGLDYLTGEKPFLEDGVIAADSLNLIVGMTMLIILFVFIGRLRYNKTHLEEDGE